MSQYEVTTAQRDFVNKLSVLEYVLGLNEYRLYATSPDFNPCDTDSVQREAELMLQHVNLSGYHPIITFRPEEENTAGHIELNDNGSREIHINIGTDSFGETVSVLCILAHEICHKVLHERKFHASTTRENEVYTDLAAMHCGFGRQMLNGCYEKKPGTTLLGVFFTEY